MKCSLMKAVNPANTRDLDLFSNGVNNFVITVGTPCAWLAPIWREFGIMYDSSPLGYMRDKIDGWGGGVILKTDIPPSLVSLFFYKSYFSA